LQGFRRQTRWLAPSDHHQRPVGRGRRRGRGGELWTRDGRTGSRTTRQGEADQECEEGAYR
jgi:hypothetical protein